MTSREAVALVLAAFRAAFDVITGLAMFPFSALLRVRCIWIIDDTIHNCPRLMGHLGGHRDAGSFWGGTR